MWPTRADLTRVGDFFPARVVRHLRADNGTVLAGGVALFVMLGLLPTITAIVSVYALGADPAQIPAHLRGLDEVLPKAVYEFITDQLQRAARRSSNELGAAVAGSVVLALWATRSAANAMLVAINHVDGAPRRWTGWRWTVITVLVAIGAVLMAFTVLSLTVALPTFGAALRAHHRAWLQNLGVPLSVMFAVIGLSTFYWLGTPHARALRHVIPGALVATSLGVLASLGLSYYVTRISYTNLYGAFGSALVVILWFYVCSLAVLTGAVVNFELRDGGRRSRVTTMPTTTAATSEEHATIATPDGPMDAYVALPAGAARGPAMIVLQEAFGVNGHIRDVCRRLAREGYVAIAPELFHRSGKGIELGYGDLPKVMPYLGELDNEGLERDVRAALGFARAHARVDPSRVGTIGFCMGGFAAYLAACRTDVATTVSFYGGGLVRERPNITLRPLIGETAQIQAPILLVFGDHDHGITAADIDQLRGALDGGVKARHEVVVYPGAGHGFFCDERPSYHAEAAALAWPKTLAWLKETLS